MSSFIRFYDRDTNTLASALALVLDPGQTSAVKEYDVWNDKGGATAGADASVAPVLVLEALNESGQWVTSGVEVLDDLWSRVTIVGTHDTGSPGFTYLSGTRAIGANSHPEYPDLPLNCAYKVNLTVTAPAGLTAATAATLRFRVRDERNAKPLADKIGLATGSGVVPATRDPGRVLIVEGLGVTADDSDAVVVAAGLAAMAGATVAHVGSSHTLNQSDVTPTALGVGESYAVTLSLGSGGVVTATKGVLSAGTPTAPAVPAGEALVGLVTVAYQVGGTSAIGTADLDSAGVQRGDYQVRAGTGLSVVVSPGTGAHESSAYRWHGAESIVPLTASVTSFLWALPDGDHAASLTEVAPVYGADLLAEADTDVTSVTAIRDRRQMLPAGITETVLRLDLGDVTATGAGKDWGVLGFDAELVSAALEASGITAGTGGAHIVDVNTLAAGAPLPGSPVTIYTSQGTADHRPSIADTATTVLRDVSVHHERRRFVAGTRFSADVDAVPTGSPTLAGARVYLTFRRWR